MERVGGGEGDGVVAAAVGEEDGDGDLAGVAGEILLGGEADLLEEVAGVEEDVVDDIVPAAQGEGDFDDAVEGAAEEDGEDGAGDSDASFENEGGDKVRREGAEHQCGRA